MHHILSIRWYPVPHNFLGHTAHAQVVCTRPSVLSFIGPGNEAKIIILYGWGFNIQCHCLMILNLSSQTILEHHMYALCIHCKILFTQFKVGRGITEVICI